METSASPLPRLLIVDDETAQMTALTRTLRDEGFATTGFSSSRAALTALRGQEFDLVITDLRMPEMDGISFLRQALEARPSLVVIVMTGHGTIDSAVEAMKAGAFDYILKPFSLSLILPVLSRALAVQRLRVENARLEQSVRERTAALEAINKELEAFSYSVSHDLRAPLRHIDGFIHMLLKDHAAHLSAEGQRLAGNVSERAQYMRRLIDDLLNLSRLGRQPLAKRPVCLQKLAQEIFAELHEERAGREIDFQMENLPDCEGDLALLRQVLINLLSNALKFTRHRPRAQIEFAGRREGPELIYFVRDNGAGFDMQYAERLFGVFQRLHRPQEFEGTGVGLSIVQRIIARHGGRVWAEAEVDRGATFYFTLPVSSEPASGCSS